MIDKDSQAYTVRLEALRRSRWVLVDTGTELREGESAERVAETVADRQEWVTGGRFRVRVWNGAGADTNRPSDSEVVREIPEFTPAMRLLLLAVIVVVLNTIILVPLAITLGTIAAVKPQWVEGAAMGQAIQWSVWIMALSATFDVIQALIRTPRRFVAFLVQPGPPEQREQNGKPRPLAENLLIETVTAALAVTAVLATQMQEPGRVAALAVTSTAVLVLARACLRHGPRIIQRQRRSRSPGD